MATQTNCTTYSGPILHSLVPPSPSPLLLHVPFVMKILAPLMKRSLETWIMMRGKYHPCLSHLWYYTVYLQVRCCGQSQDLHQVSRSMVLLTNTFSWLMFVIHLNNSFSWPMAHLNNGLTWSMGNWFLNCRFHSKRGGYIMCVFYMCFCYNFVIKH